MSVPYAVATQAGAAPVSAGLRPWNDTEKIVRRDSGKKPYVVLIEDNLGDVLLVEEALREHQVDCDFAVVNDGEEAVGLFEAIDKGTDTRLPDLVLLDLNLPKRSGHEVLDRIRRSARCSTTPVVIVTSSRAQSDLARTKELGATAYFHKPINFDEFMKLGLVVRDLL